MILALGIVWLFENDPDGGHQPLLAGVLAAVLLVPIRSRWPSSWSWTWGRAIRLTGLAWLVPSLALIAAIAPENGPPELVRLRSELISRCRFLESPVEPVERLAVWCRHQTPESARFIGPPGPKTFRLWSRPALAFTRAASPYHAEGLADWADRFADHVDFEGSTAAFARAYLNDRHGLEQRFDQQTADQLAALARRQGASYVLALAPDDDQPMPPGSPLVPIRVDGDYAIYRLNEGSHPQIAKRDQTTPGSETEPHSGTRATQRHEPSIRVSQ